MVKLAYKTEGDRHNPIVRLTQPEFDELAAGKVPCCKLYLDDTDNIWWLLQDIPAEDVPAGMKAMRSAARVVIRELDS